VQQNQSIRKKKAAYLSAKVTCTLPFMCLSYTLKVRHSLLIYLQVSAMLR